MAYRLVAPGNGYLTYSDRVADLDGATRIQVSCWVKPVSGTGQTRQMYVCQNDATLNTGLNIGNQNYTVNSVAFSNIGDQIKLGSSCLTTDAWNHVWIVMNGTAASLRANDGAVTLTGGGIGATCPANSQPFLIGKASDNTLYSNCEIAEVAIWVGGDLLDATTVTALAAGRLPTAQGAYLSALVFYAPLRAHAHDVVASRVGTAQNGATLVDHPAAVDVYTEDRVAPRPRWVSVARPSVARRTV